MRVYKVNEKLIIDLDKIVALEDIVGSYKLVMIGNSIFNLEKQEYLNLLQELQIEKDNDLFVNMGIDDKPMKEQSVWVDEWGNK